MRQILERASAPCPHFPPTDTSKKTAVCSRQHASTSTVIFFKMAMTMMSFPRSYYPPHTPITQQLCLRLYVGGLPLSLVRVHVKDRPKIGELLQIYDNLLLAHLM